MGNANQEDETAYVSASSWNNEAALGIGGGGPSGDGAAVIAGKPPVPAPASRNVWWNTSRKTTTVGHPCVAFADNMAGSISRRTSGASSVMLANGETEDLYCDDELHPSLENDPNMQLSCAAEAAAAQDVHGVDYPARPILNDRVSVLSMEIPSTGPQSLRSELDGDDKDMASLPTIPDIDDDEAATPTQEIWN